MNKKKLLFFVISIVIFATASSTLACVESGDKGKDYYLKGTTSVGRMAFTDYCLPNGNLAEFYCSNTRPMYEEFDCPGICSDGKCISEDCTNLNKKILDFINVFGSASCGDANYRSIYDANGDKVINSSDSLKVVSWASSSNNEACRNQLNNPSNVCPSVQPSITVTSPNGGETLEVGKTYDISWKSSNISNKISITLTPDDGSFQYVITPYPYISASDSSYKWTVQQDIKVGQKFKIIVGTTDGMVTDYSDNYFNIVEATSTHSVCQNATCVSVSGFGMDECAKDSDCASTQPSITVTSPNGGETLEVGKTYDILWKVSNFLDTEKLVIQLVGDSNLWGFAQSLPNTGKYSWTVPSPLPDENNIINGGKYKIRIDNAAALPGRVATDSSDNYFTIVENANSNASSVTCYEFKNNLFYGSRGDDVLALQNILKKEGFESFITKRKDKDGVFGLGTYYALKAFQEKYKDEILTPYRLKYSTGNAGPSTLKKLNSLYMCKNTAQMSEPLKALNCLELSSEINNFINKYGNSVKCVDANFNAKYDVNNDCVINASDSLANTNKCNAINDSSNAKSGALLEDLQKQVASLADAIAKLLSQLKR